MTKERYIYHVDINHCFAQIEELIDPSLKEVPMCVGGDEKKRSGIVLARNLMAKEYGVKTAETLRDALRKCPHLVIVPGRMRDYLHYTTQVKNILKEYSDKVESYGLDEAWVDVTHSWKLFGKPYDIPRIIQNRILDEVGLTVSIGVSFNKVFAKLGSDMMKPSGLVYITPVNYKEIVWPLPVESLLFIGGKTMGKLHLLNIYTIGDLATAPVEILKHAFGIKGIQMHRYANGFESSEVKPVGYVEPPKSVSNGFTPPHDLNSLMETRILMQHLCDSIASRLKDIGKQGTIVSISPRDITLQTFTRQRKIETPTDVSTVILDYATELLRESVDFSTPLRSISVGVSGLVDAKHVPQQLNLFESMTKETTRQAKIDETIDGLRKRFGYHVIKRASAVMDESVVNLDVKKHNVVYPGRSKDHEAVEGGIRKPYKE